MDYLHGLINTVLHIDIYLNHFLTVYGFWTYLALFAIIFCETGLVVTPFLPGDSLLFTAGSIAAQQDNTLNVLLLLPLLIGASILGNHTNFIIGRILGPKLFSADDSWLLNKKHLQQSHAFYEKHGGKALIFARFIPIIRTFAPFVAGIADMKLHHFICINLISGLLWIGSLLGLGYFLGSIPLVKEHLTMVIYGVIFISLMPPMFSFLAHKVRNK